jgi:ubiquinone biosynthesis protein UbiJ
MSEEKQEGLGGFVSGLQQKAGEFAEGLKDKLDDVAEVITDKVEDVVGEENLKKVTDVLNTDVGVIARDAVDKTGDVLGDLKEKAEDAFEKVTGQGDAEKPE